MNPNDTLPSSYILAARRLDALSARLERRRLRLVVAASAVMGFSVGLIVAITLYSLHVLP